MWASYKQYNIRVIFHEYVKIEQILFTLTMTEYDSRHLIVLSCSIRFQVSHYFMNPIHIIIIRYHDSHKTEHLC